MSRFKEDPSCAQFCPLAEQFVTILFKPSQRILPLALRAIAISVVSAFPAAPGWTRSLKMEAPQPSQRIIRTDDPCIVTMQVAHLLAAFSFLQCRALCNNYISQKMMRGTDGILSLAQGIVHWKPPPSAIRAASHVSPSIALTIAIDSKG